MENNENWVKNLVQAIAAVVVAIVVGTVGSIVVSTLAYILFMALGAWEKNRALSVFEVVIGSIGLISLLLNWLDGYVTIGVAVFLAIESLVFVIGPAKAWIISLDSGGEA